MENPSHCCAVPVYGKRNWWCEGVRQSERKMTQRLSGTKQHCQYRVHQRKKKKNSRVFVLQVMSQSHMLVQKVSPGFFSYKSWTSHFGFFTTCKATVFKQLRIKQKVIVHNTEPCKAFHCCKILQEGFHLNVVHILNKFQGSLQKKILIKARFYPLMLCEFY